MADRLSRRPQPDREGLPMICTHGGRSSDMSDPKLRIQARDRDPRGRAAQGRGHGRGAAFQSISPT